MAITKLKDRPTRAAGRLPGETADQWTARNARLARNATGRWVVKYTEILTAPDGSHDHRTQEVSTRETDRMLAEQFLADWREMYVNQRKALAPRHTFQDVVDDYATTRTLRHSPTNDYAAARLCEFLGADPADAIQERRLGELHTWLIQTGKAPGTVRKLLSVALTLLNHAERRGMIPRNSAPKYRMPPQPPSRPHALTQDQKDEVFAAALAWGQDDRNTVKLRVGLFVCIALETAQRRDAIRELTWDRCNLTGTARSRLGAETIDFTTGRPMPKNKRRCASAPISPALLAVLKRAALTAPKNARGEPTGPVFPSDKIIDGFHAFRDHLGMPDWFTPHVFRHTWVTLAWSRTPLTVISAITGDSIATLERTYAHLTTETVRDTLRRYLWSDTPAQKDQTHVAPELVG